MKSKEVKSEDVMVFRTKTEPDFMPIPQALLDEIAEMEALESERR